METRGNPDGIKPDYWGAVKVLAEQYRVILLGLAGLVAAFGVLALTFFCGTPYRTRSPGGRFQQLRPSRYGRLTARPTTSGRQRTLSGRVLRHSNRPRT